MKKSLTLFIASLVLFGSNGVIAAQIDLPSQSIVVLRTFLGAALLAGVLLARRIWPAARAQEASVPGLGSLRRDYLFAILAGVAMGASWLFLYRAYVLVGVGLASLLYYVAPVIVMMLSPVLFGEKLTPVRVAGFATVLAGMLLLNATGAQGYISTEGLLYGFGSALCLAAMLVLTKKATALEGVQKSCIQLAAACVVSTIAAALTQGLAFDAATVNWPAVLVLGLVNTGFGCCLYFSAMSKLPVQTVAACGYIEPVSAVVMAVLFLGEVLLPLQVLGAVLVVAGAAASELGPSVLGRLHKPELAKVNARHAGLAK